MADVSKILVRVAISGIVVWVARDSVDIPTAPAHEELHDTISALIKPLGDARSTGRDFFAIGEAGDDVAPNTSKYARGDLGSSVVSQKPAPEARSWSKALPRSSTIHILSTAPTRGPPLNVHTV